MVNELAAFLRTHGTLRAAACLLAVSVSLVALPAHSRAQTEGNHLYNVTLLRAAPGHFTDLVAALEESFALNRQAGDEPPFWFRHSQGDHWDFMLIYPVGDFLSYYSPDRVQRRSSVWSSGAGAGLTNRLAGFTSYKEEWFSRSVPVEEMARRFEGMGFFHVEMFVGLAGKREELLEQRRMENRYYEALGRQLNLLFVRESGSSWDAMTIGFYDSLQAYAGAGTLHSPEQQDIAARGAGFSGGTSGIGPYLRSLLDHHHDTLGVRVR